MKSPVWLGLLAGTSLGVQAAVVTFTAAEGYSGTGAVGVWGSSLQAQVANSAIWKETSWGTYAVDSTAGIVNVGSAGFKKAVYNEELSASQNEYNVSITFSFNRSTNALSATAYIMSVELPELYDPLTGGRIALSLQRMPGANSGKYQLSFYENTGAVASSGAAGWSDETLWGFANATDTSSDALYLAMTVFRGANASSWMVSGVLSNMVTGASVAMGTNAVGAFDTSSAYFENNLYGVIGSGSGDVAANTSNRVVSRFEAGSPPKRQPVLSLVVIH